MIHTRRLYSSSRSHSHLIHTSHPPTPPTPPAGRFWASVDDGAKEHCIYLFADFLYRNWTSHPLVLDCFQRELKTLPPVLQFALLQVCSCVLCTVV